MESVACHQLLEESGELTFAVPNQMLISEELQGEKQIGNETVVL